MDDYLSKPVQLAEIERVLAHWIAAAPTAALVPSRVAVDGGVAVSLLDLDVIANLRALEEPGEPGLLTELIAAFRSSAPAHIARLKTTLAADDAPAFGDAAHALKGGAATLGAARLRRAAYDLELRGRDCNLVDAEAQLIALEIACTEALDALTQEDAARCARRAA